MKKVIFLAIAILFTISLQAQNKKYGQKKVNGSIVLIDSTVFTTENRVITDEKVFADSSSFSADLLNRVRNLKERKTELERLLALTNDEIAGIIGVYDKALGTGEYTSVKNAELLQSLQGVWTLERRDGANTTTSQVTITGNSMVNGGKTGTIVVTGEDTFTLTGWETTVQTLTQVGKKQEFKNTGSIILTLKR